MVSLETYTPTMYAAYGLVKAVPAPGTAEPGKEWELFIQSSSEDIDLEGERVMQAALRRAAPFYLARGRLTWEHITNETRLDPSIYVGQPLDVRFTDDGRTLERGWLYQSPNKPKAREAWGILESGGSLYASIGGMRLDDGGKKVIDGVPTITSLLWTHTALTPYAVNYYTNVQTIPPQEFYKALGTAGASSLVMEDLEGSRQRGTPAFYQRWKALTEILMQQYPALTAKACQQHALAILVRRGEARQAFAPMAPLYDPQPRS